MNIVSGRASNRLREAFMNSVDAFKAWEDGQPEPTISRGGSVVPISRVCGLLWNCTDTLPVSYVNTVASLQHWNEKPVRQGASDAQCARVMRRLIARDAA